LLRWLVPRVQGGQVLTHATFPLFLRQSDAVDDAVAARAGWKWSEDALTTLLCDLLAETHQLAYRLEYALSDLRSDLAATAAPVPAHGRRRAAPD
jgi:hypothetical protein